VIPRIVLVGMMLWVGLAFGADLQGLLPDPDKTPGVADPALTMEVLCAKKFTTRDVRSVSGAMKVEVYSLYDRENHAGACAKSKRGCEIDHLVSLELGGANDVKNLWPQPFGKPWGAEVKDKLENKLHALVCAGEIDLATAQQEISADWIEAYKKYVK
jgi:hypothetical protein